MTANERIEVLKTAARCVKNGLASGLQGPINQGLDRFRACGINVSGCEGSREGLKHLVEMTEIGLVF